MGAAHVALMGRVAAGRVARYLPARVGETAAVLAASHRDEAERERERGALPPLGPGGAVVY